ncbi:ABC transporter ATP-binding protein [Roseimaritima ulvae]|uniref:ABC transporter ATP-binding protein n=1 Tax=Roseimaritima ulvae TaxID=980254 RepID=UPI001EE4C74C|nr:ABC transporter ATP-binding protein [Roseimaritima ulvae]
MTKSYAGQRAVDALDLQIRSGEFLVLVGPSGCGKSTTLRMIAGLESPDAGEIHFDDRAVTRLPARARDVAMVFQDYALYPHMTVRQNLAFGLKMRRVGRAEIASRTAATASALGIEPLLDRRPDQLSGGQQQRVAVGRAIVRQPAVFLLDEPLSNLDARLRDELRVELVRLHRQLGTTMVYVTHDQTEAMMMGQRVAAMEGGRILQIDTPMQLYRQPRNRFVASLIGSPAMNFIPARRQDGQWVSGTYRWPVAFAAAASDPGPEAIEIGIRPSAFRLQPTDPQELALSLTVDVVQPLGATALLQCNGLGQRLSVVCDQAAVPQVGDRIEVYVAAEELHGFDAQNGENLKSEI